MYDQEMQFADPDWKPTRPLNSQAQDQDAYVPQPVNDDLRKAREQQKQQTVLSQQDGYRGLPPYTPTTTPSMPSPYFSPASQKVSPFPARQRMRRGGWFWIVIAIIILSVISSSFTRGSYSHRGPDSSSPSFLGNQGQSFAVGNAPTLVVNNNFGAITVQTGDVGTITVRSSDGIQNDLGAQQDQTNNTLSVTVSSKDLGAQSADITVTVPPNTVLQLQDGAGDINVAGVSGKMSLTTTSGSITTSDDTITGNSLISAANGTVSMTGDTLSGTYTITAGNGVEMSQENLSGNASISTTGGSITFNGSLDRAGRYQLKTGSGDIGVTIPGNSNVQIHASPGRGSFTNNFPGASTSIGKSPQASLTLTTDSGSIQINQQ